MTAETVTREWTEAHYGVELPHAEAVIRTDNPRAAFVAKMRELVDRVECGALNGARCEWNDNPDQPAMVVVESYPVVDGRRTTRLLRITFAPLTPKLRLVEGG